MLTGGQGETKDVEEEQVAGGETEVTLPFLDRVIARNYFLT